MEKQLKANPVPLYLPIGSENDFSGIIDLINMKKITFDSQDYGETLIVSEIDESLLETAHAWRENLIDKVSNYDEEIMDLFFNEEEIPTQKNQKSIKRRNTKKRITSCFL